MRVLGLVFGFAVKSNLFYSLNKIKSTKHDNLTKLTVLCTEIYE